MNLSPLFVEVILPLPVPGTFTYGVPEELIREVATGKRAVVQFGSKKIYTALIRSLHKDPPEKYEVKNILAVLDCIPVANPIQLQLWEWIASYYMASLGDVMNAALPAGFKLQSETRLIPHPEFSRQETMLNEKEYLIAEALENRKELSITDISKIVDQAKVLPLIKNLIDKKVMLVKEELVQHYKPKTEYFVLLSPEFDSDEKLNALFDELNKRAYKQLEILLSFLKLSSYPKPGHQAVKRIDLLKNAKASLAQFQALQKKGVFQVSERIVSRLKQKDNVAVMEPVQLTEHQAQAYASLKEQLGTKETILLFGVTSSGKTEIYIQLIQEYLQAGQQVLYLLPEIALTTQIISRLQRYFGNKVGVYHSRYSDYERVEIWNNVLGTGPEPSEPFQIILGARSALFLPFSNLGLIIVDEEHDTSFKQQDPAPRYNARDAALYLARLHHAKTILGSATPALETYFLATGGKFGLVTLTERYGGIQLPEIQLVNIKEESRLQRMKSVFSAHLLHKIDHALQQHKQVILFQNRRGFSLRIECETCDWMPPCKNCDVTLIYHKKADQLRCHYCGYSIPVPVKCPECQGTRLLMKGFGTEKVEEELAVFFPKARIVRMDLDTTRTRHAHQRIIQDFEEQKIDILVGTQMVTKGLDFDHVSLVSILNADNMINFPDFRSHERSYHLMSQVSGRAGRKGKQGLVIIQSYNPSHPVIQKVIGNDYQGMFQEALIERQRYHYPPYYRLVILRLRHRDFKFLNEAARDLAVELRASFQGEILGPEYPVVSRIKNKYIKQIMIKLDRRASPSSDKKIIQNILQKFLSRQAFKQLDIVIDVDPL